MNKLFITKKYQRSFLAITLTLVVLLSVAAPVIAQGNKAAPEKKVLNAPVQGQGPSDPAELEAFLDELMAKDMEEYHIAGAAVSVVKDGRLFFAKGYGYADLENKIPVDPEQTGFRIGSVTKLFTWTAVMQLVEQEKLDLNADINTYLDFRIPDTYPEPITLRHLLTHTSGFEQIHTDILVSEADDLVPAREFLVSHMAARVRPPGICVAYSNFNSDLAGYIVAQVSGQPYDQYVKEHILDPLGMVHTTASSPMPPDLYPRASVGYTYNNGAFQVYPDYMAQLASVPGAAIQASATDMARFMIAHLQGGYYSDSSIAKARILEESTVMQMHSTLYTPDSRLLGVAYGFFDFSDNGQRAIGHSGGAPPMNSNFLLLPDQNLGIFVVYNSEGGEDLTLQHLGFQRAFFDHYYTATAVEPIQPPADFAERAGRLVGSYRVTESSYSTIEKVVGLFGAFEISDPGDGTLLFNMSGLEFRFVEVEPLYFRQVDGPFGLTFREDDRGRITHIFTDLTPMWSFERLSWYETPAFNMGLALVSVLIFLSMIPGALIHFILDRRQRGDRKPTSRGAHLAYWVILGLGLLNLLFVISTALWGNPVPLFGISTIYRIVLGLGVLSAVLTARALVYTVLAWKNRYWGILGRLYYTLVTVAAVAFVWFLNYWNLLGWR